MASQRITCPECKSVLRPAKPVPDGKQVRCPKCGHQFVTPGLLEAVEEVIQVVEEDRPQKKSSGKKKAKTGIKKASGPKPPPKKSVHDDDDDDDGGVYSFVGANASGDEAKPEIEYAPDMSIKDLRGPAQAVVVKPSNYILLINGLSCLANIFLICVQFWPMVFSDSVVDWKAVLYREAGGDQKQLNSRIEGMKEYKDLKDKDLEIVQAAEDKEREKRFMLMGGFILLLVYNAVAIVGAVKMQNLESRRWGIASSIMTLLPMGALGFGYLIWFAFAKTVGGWLLDELADYYGAGMGALPYLFAMYVSATSLRILMSQEVIDGFEYIAE